MFRKSNGSLGFSFNKFINNAVPNLAADPNREANIPVLGQDMLYVHQLATKGPNAPYALDERSLLAGGICNSESLSVKVFGKLRSAGAVSEAGLVDTRNINWKQFPHQLAVLSSPRQKDLINLLFWWEEECVRLRKLMADRKALDEQITNLETDIRGDIPETEEPDDDQERRKLIDLLKFEREKLRMRIDQKPSERRTDVETGTDSLFADTGTVALSGGRGVASSGEVIKPPAYRS